ncbi:unnamed protein product [Euphydryas editha]|uniref:Cilia- and flagella-associated protein 99-like n=1 Tax=Euphydryas editha TaxID=104508 RepID=A0AAU9TW70_EUPED|nr:unnamed protein product [Euphydryas editha]
MVYYHTSKNVKMLRNVINDYRTCKETSPCEYMKTYIEKCPETMENVKITWTVESFLSIQKHGQFLEELKSYISKELSEEDQDYFVIIFIAIIFQITPKDAPLLYKCLFNVSRPLLKTFTTLLSSDEVLSFISQVAQSYYDTNFITEKIIEPLFTWKPYLKDMMSRFNRYVSQIENQKIRHPTIPVTPNVLSRKIKKSILKPFKDPSLSTPPNSLRKEAKMLTKSAIDQKLKQIHDINKQKALCLLHTVKTQKLHYANEKSEKYYTKLSSIKEEIKNEYENTFSKSKSKVNLHSTPPVVKETATTLKRINNRIQLSEKEELQWLEDLLVNCKNTTKIEELEEYDRQERERERLLDIERKHLLGKISYEDAVIAKRKLYDENKKKYEHFLKEKRLWEEEIEKWKRNEMIKNRKQVEKLSLLELDMLHAKNINIAKKKENADKLRKETEKILSRAIKEKHEELERKINMIRELKILGMIAKKVKVPKIIDLTESSGLGLLCEMSIAELQEKLNLIKIELKEELDKKRKTIKEQKQAAKNDLEETKNAIQTYMSEREDLRKQKKNQKKVLDISSSKEIKNLKKILEEKRNLRIKLTV